MNWEYLHFPVTCESLRTETGAMNRHVYVHHTKWHRMGLSNIRQEFHRVEEPQRATGVYGSFALQQPY